MQKQSKSKEKKKKIVQNYVKICNFSLRITFSYVKLM